MTALAVLVLAATVAVVAAIYLTTGDRVLRSRTKRRVMVSTDSGAWFAGVLIAQDRRSVLLSSVTTEGADGVPTSVDGEVLILVEDIAHIQFP